MTSKQRAYLMSLASNLNPIFQVGKSSLTPELTAAIGESFNNNSVNTVLAMVTAMTASALGPKL